MKNRFSEALFVQDAGNLKAIARAFVEVVDAAHEETKSTQATWEDPAVRLFADKIFDLCMRLGDGSPLVKYAKAYEACQERCGER